jgi:hypothetical protein
MVETLTVLANLGKAIADAEGWCPLVLMRSLETAWDIILDLLVAHGASLAGNTREPRTLTEREFLLGG